MQTRILSLLVVLASLVPMTIACSTPDEEPVAREYKVTIADYKFIPNEMTMPAGTKVTVVNKDRDDHSFVCAGGPEARGIKQNASRGLVFDKPGTYTCTDTANQGPGLKAVITVK